MRMEVERFRRFLSFAARVHKRDVEGDEGQVDEHVGHK